MIPDAASFMQTSIIRSTTRSSSCSFSRVLWVPTSSASSASTLISLSKSSIGTGRTREPLLTVLSPSQRYLAHYQLQVTLILVSLAQSVHELTPPDVLTPVIRKLAQEFVHPGVGSEVVAAGINAIREVCRRQPWCMEEDLLGDLIEYRKSKDKGVVTASRGLLQLFREVNPGLLKRRERGKAATMGLTTDQVPEFGHTRSNPDGIDGLNLLEAHLAKQEEGDGEDEGDENDGGWSDWEAESEEEDSDEEGWQNVSSDSENEVDISDSDDDDEEKTRRQKKRETMEKRIKTIQEVDEMADEDEQDATDMAAVSQSVGGESTAMAVADAPAAAPISMSLLAQQKVGHTQYSRVSTPFLTLTYSSLSDSHPGRFRPDQFAQARRRDRRRQQRRRLCSQAQARPSRSR